MSQFKMYCIWIVLSMSRTPADRNDIVQLSSVWEHCLSSTGIEVLLSSKWEHCLYLPQEWGIAVTDEGTLSLSSTGMRYCCHWCGNTVSIFHRNEVLPSLMWEHCLYLPQEWGTAVIGVGTLSLSSTGMRYCSHRCGNSLYLPQEWCTAVTDIGTLSLSSTAPV